MKSVIKGAKTFKKHQKLNNSFEYFITSTIVVNALILTLKWPGMTPKTEFGIEIVNYICTAIFILEAIIKLTATGKNYFRSGWNIFDFTIVIASIIFMTP